jgi:hypothetical protein
MGIPLPVQKRDDLSRFLIHLTRDLKDSSAKDNLIGILKDKKIEARNAHCLVMHKLEQMRFTKLLRWQFNSVCFTEAPLSQVSQLTRLIPKRSIELRPYGVVFWKDHLMDCGANPAIYLNAQGNSLSRYLIKQFEEIFKDVQSLKSLKAAEERHYKSIIQLYALLNVFNRERNFMWEREWRHMGDLSFKYSDLVAIIAKNPQSFLEECEDRLSPIVYGKYIKRIPIIDPSWHLEEVVEALAIQMWNQK